MLYNVNSFIYNVHRLAAGSMKYAINAVKVAEDMRNSLLYRE